MAAKKISLIKLKIDLEGLKDFRKNDRKLEKRKPRNQRVTESYAYFVKNLSVIWFIQIVRNDSFPIVIRNSWFFTFSNLN